MREGPLGRRRGEVAEAKWGLRNCFASCNPSQFHFFACSEARTRLHAHVAHTACCIVARSSYSERKRTLVVMERRSTGSSSGNRLALARDADPQAPAEVTEMEAGRNC